MFAIGNGTASHETEVFAADVIKELNCGITYMVVSEGVRGRRAAGGAQD